MHTSPSPRPALAPRPRLVGACAAVGASATVLGLVLALFASASSTPWLPDTPEAIAQAATCNRAADRAARDACLKQTAARWQASERVGVRLASGH